MGDPELISRAIKCGKLWSRSSFKITSKASKVLRCIQGIVFKDLGNAYQVLFLRFKEDKMAPTMDGMDLIALHLETWLDNNPRCKAKSHYQDGLSLSVEIEFDNETFLTIHQNQHGFYYEIVRTRKERIITVRTRILKPINDPDFFEDLNALSELCLSLSKMSNKKMVKCMRLNYAKRLSFDNERPLLWEIAECPQTWVSGREHE